MTKINTTPFQPAFFDRVEYQNDLFKNSIEEIFHLHGWGGEYHTLTPVKDHVYTVLTQSETKTWRDDVVNVAKVLFWATLIIPIALLILRKNYRSSVSIEAPAVEVAIEKKEPELPKGDEEKVGLSLVRQSPASFIDKTTFPKHLEILQEDGSLKPRGECHIPIKQKVLQCGLSPFYVMTVDGKKIYLSRLFSPVTDQLAAIAYGPESDETLTPTILCYSKDKWKVIVKMNAKKSPCEVSDVPHKTNLALEWMRTSSGKPSVSEWTKEIFFNTPERD